MYGACLGCSWSGGLQCREGRAGALQKGECALGWVIAYLKVWVPQGYSGEDNPDTEKLLWELNGTHPVQGLAQGRSSKNGQRGSHPPQQCHCLLPNTMPSSPLSFLTNPEMPVLPFRERTRTFLPYKGTTSIYCFSRVYAQLYGFRVLETWEKLFNLSESSSLM